MEGLDLQILADIVSAVTAGITLAAHKLRTCRHVITRLESLHIRPHCYNDTRVLVPLHHRIDTGGVQSVIGMNLTTANSNTLYVNQHLMAFQIGCCRSRYFPKLNMFGFD